MSSPTPDRRKSIARRLVLIAVIAVLGLPNCFLYGVIASDVRGVSRVYLWEADLQRNLPVGSSREQAEAWFTARGLQASPYCLGIARDIKPGHILSASVPDNDWLMDATIFIQVEFDDEGRVRWVTA